MGAIRRHRCTAGPPGWTGVDDVFSGADNFFQAYAPNANPALMAEALGERREVTRTDIKRWTVGSPISRWTPWTTSCGKRSSRHRGCPRRRPASTYFLHGAQALDVGPRDLPSFTQRLRHQRRVRIQQADCALEKCSRAGEHVMDVEPPAVKPAGAAVTPDHAVPSRQNATCLFDVVHIARTRCDARRLLRGVVQHPSHLRVRSAPQAPTAAAAARTRRRWSVSSGGLKKKKKKFFFLKKKKKKIFFYKKKFRN